MLRVILPQRHRRPYPAIATIAILHAMTQPPRPARNVWSAVRRGAARRCPSCGRGNVYDRYLKVACRCNACGEELHHHRADDAPPYFTIFIVGHLVVPLMLWSEKMWHPEMWIHMSLWLPLAFVLTLVLLPIVKGAVVGLQWGLYMHGFELKAAEQYSSGDYSSSSSH